MKAIKGLKKNIRRDWMLLLIVLPGVIYFAVFCYGPMYGILMAFKNMITYPKEYGEAHGWG